MWGTKKIGNLLEVKLQRYRPVFYTIVLCLSKHLFLSRKDSQQQANYNIPLLSLGLFSSSISRKNVILIQTSGLWWCLKSLSWHPLGRTILWSEVCRNQGWLKLSSKSQIQSELPVALVWFQMHILKLCGNEQEDY